ncbi:Threonine/Lysine efflux protein LysE family [Vibrio crassostreae]|uniref:Threonine/Lysine efflux protein LysE family n=1 Tax=Vibrio crassostreae TaxID=246167 RepID=A0A4R2FZU9_9VIBR|nr:MULTISPECIES: LysE family translocator [Vibrio]MDH5950985.1 LysE family translocator [Vibrio crassostreae]ROR63646.1 threonine/homoserine/homoserine lactone efflux protein [Vibrio crassostreae]ROS66481.1 threonine/homoserine/homoserine lactone efflux protein [Vibrio crassostreae]RPF14928.1 threonine/homoserine/homoserine lactone efflux protein [Vibrio crassostreae]TCL21720.1 threonine/homoserine/homoserine lactone efflux protein [Vibrio crassostreae]
MIDLAILPVYLTAVVALLLLPGPDMLLIASSSMSYGRKVGVFASLGNATSGIILTVLAAMGVSALIAMSPVALKALHLLGGTYLLKMGWDCLRTEQGNAPELGDNFAAKAYYQRALISNLLNPKALVFFVMFLPQFVSTNIEATSGEQMLVLGLLLNVLGLTFNFLLVALVGTIGKSLVENAKFRTYQQKVMGGVFIVLAIWMLSSFFTS